MRLDEIEGKTYTESDLDSLVSYIRRNCRSWLLKSNGEPVYRGIKYTGHDIAFTKPIRANREPRDSTPVKHLIFNEMLNRLGNVNRENSAFVNRDSGIAGEYGHPFVFMPIGEFEYAWSPEFQDWTTDFNLHKIVKTASELYNMDIINVNKALNQRFKETGVWKDEGFRRPEARQVAKEIVDEEIDMSRLASVIKVNEGLDRALRARHEIMIKADAGIYIRQSPYLRIRDQLIL